MVLHPNQEQHHKRNRITVLSKVYAVVQLLIPAEGMSTQETGAFWTAMKQDRTLLAEIPCSRKAEEDRYTHIVDAIKNSEHSFWKKIRRPPRAHRP